MLCRYRKSIYKYCEVKEGFHCIPILIYFIIYFLISTWIFVLLFIFQLKTSLSTWCQTTTFISLLCIQLKFLHEMRYLNFWDDLFVSMPFRRIWIYTYSEGIYVYVSINDIIIYFYFDAFALHFHYGKCQEYQLQGEDCEN